MNYQTLLQFRQQGLQRLMKHRFSWLIGVATLPFLGVLTAVAVAPGAAQQAPLEVREVSQSLALPALPAGQSDGSRYWREERIQRGDTIARLLNRLGVGSNEANRFIHTAPVSRDVLKLRAGATLSVQINDQGELFGLRFLNDDENGEKVLVVIEKQGEQWQASAEPPRTEVIQAVRSVEIRTSLSGALAQAGVPVEVRTQLGEIFSDQLDTTRLQAGDRVNLVYETLLYKGSPIANGNVLAAEIQSGGKTWQAFYFAHDSESGAYYDAAGQSLRKGFSNQPVSNARISSGFGMRFHPVLRSLRMHEGIDYAASSGTPIMATSDGVVDTIASQSGYGNVVILKHNAKLSTLYAHMSRFEPKLTRGSKVSAGQVIGYVGSTGRSTGPHLHMEVRVNGQAVDPSTTALPVPGLSTQQRLAFRQQSVKLAANLKLLREIPVSVAQLE